MEKTVSDKKRGVVSVPSGYESPYSASCADVCELLVASLFGPGIMKDCVNRMRGLEIALPFPAGYVYYVGCDEDTILTERDLDYWRVHPLMLGEFCVIGAIGHKRTLAWDRRALAVNAAGHIYMYEMYLSSFIVKIAESLAEFISEGLSKNYVQLQRSIFGGLLPRAVEVCGGASPRSPWLPPDCKEWLPIEVGGVLCAKIPSEKIIRGSRLRAEDFPEWFFKNNNKSTTTVTFHTGSGDGR